jgi:hypothetical protein
MNTEFFVFAPKFLIQITYPRLYAELKKCRLHKVQTAHFSMAILLRPREKFILLSALPKDNSGGFRIANNGSVQVDKNGT